MQTNKREANAVAAAWPKRYQSEKTDMNILILSCCELLVKGAEVECGRGNEIKGRGKEIKS